MTRWVLRVQVRGEWEECAFGTRQEALAAFRALAADYPAEIHRAVLIRDQISEPFIVADHSTARSSGYVN